MPPKRKCSARGNPGSNAKRNRSSRVVRAPPRLAEVEPQLENNPSGRTLPSLVEQCVEQQTPLVAEGTAVAGPRGMVDPPSHKSANNGMCANKWHKVFENSADGKAVFGDKSQLIQAALHGAKIRVILNDDYATSLQNVHSISNNLCGQALFHISKAGYDAFQTSPYWWFLTVCTTGNVHMSRWYVGKHESPSETKKTYRLQWFVRYIGCSDPFSTPVISLTEDGTIIQGNTEDVISAVDTGADITMVNRKSGYSTAFDNIGYDASKGLVGGQALWHVSKVQTGNHYSFQKDAYWWFTMWSTSGKLDMSRWSIGAHTSKGHTSSKEPQDWYADSCWTLVYHHNEEGVHIDGSLEAFREAVQSGQKVKLVRESYSIEPDQIEIRDGHVYGLFLNHMSKASVEMFQDKAYWFWQLISTTGTVKTIRYYVGALQPNGKQETTNSAGKWFVSTRKFHHILTHDGNGNVHMGSKDSLIAAIQSGAEVRVRLERSSVFQVDNLAVKDGNVGAMHVRSVHIEKVSFPRSEFQFAIPPVWYFKIISTGGKLTTTGTKVGEFQANTPRNENVWAEWFVSY